MTTYKVEVPEPPNPGVFKLWDRDNDQWTREAGSNKWRFRGWGSVYEWAEVVATHGPLTDTPPIKEGDTGLTAEKAWPLPIGSVIWPENAERQEPLMRLGDYWESVSIIADNAGELQCYCGDSFRVLILGGEK